MPERAGASWTIPTHQPLSHRGGSQVSQQSAPSPQLHHGCLLGTSVRAVQRCSASSTSSFSTLPTPRSGAVEIGASASELTSEEPKSSYRKLPLPQLKQRDQLGDDFSQVDCAPPSNKFALGTWCDGGRALSLTETTLCSTGATNQPSSSRRSGSGLYSLAAIEPTPDDDWTPKHTHEGRLRQLEQASAAHALILDQAKETRMEAERALVKEMRAFVTIECECLRRQVLCEVMDRIEFLIPREEFQSLQQTFAKLHSRVDEAFNDLKTAIPQLQKDHAALAGDMVAHTQRLDAWQATFEQGAAADSLARTAMEKSVALVSREVAELDEFVNQLRLQLDTYTNSAHTTHERLERHTKAARDSIELLEKQMRKQFVEMQEAQAQARREIEHKIRELKAWAVEKIEEQGSSAVLANRSPRDINVLQDSGVNVSSIKDANQTPS